MCYAFHGEHCVTLVNLQFALHCYMGIFNLTTTSAKPGNKQMRISLCDTKIRYISVSHKLYIIIQDIFRLAYVIKSIQVLTIYQTLPV